MPVRRQIPPRELPRNTKRALLALLSAALYTAAMPPWQLTLLGWFALVPLALALRGLSPGRGALLGLLWGTTTIWGIGHWVPGAVTTYWGQSLLFGILFSLAGSVVFVGSYGAAFAACACWITRVRPGLPRALIFACLWVSWEFARGHLLTGDPWLLIGYALVPHVTLMQAADLGGIYLLSFAVSLVNFALAEVAATLVAGETRRRTALATAVCCGLVLASLYAYGTYRLSQPLPQERTVPIALVQGNNDPGSKWRSEHHGRGLDRYIRLSRQIVDQAKPAVMVWPESAVTFFLAHEPAHRARITRLAEETGTDLLVGAPHYENPDPAHPQYFNSAFYVTNGDQLPARYDKVHLLPFGEYFPLRTIQFLRRRFERVRTFTPGKSNVLLETRMGKAAVAICFEAIFPEIVRQRMATGAEILVNLSNDAWLGSYAGPAQHLAMTVPRAVENRTWMVRSTTTGISAIVDPFGRIVARSEIGAVVTLVHRVTPLRVATLYQVWGDWVAYLCLLVSAAGTLQHRKTRA